jgi:hypothetical protein
MHGAILLLLLHSDGSGGSEHTRTFETPNTLGTPVVFSIAGRSNITWQMWAPGGQCDGSAGGGGGAYAEGEYVDTGGGETVLHLITHGFALGNEDCRVLTGDGDFAGAGIAVDAGSPSVGGGTGGTVQNDDHNWATLTANGGNGHVSGGGGAAGGPSGDGANASGATGAVGVDGAGSGGSLNSSGTAPGGGAGGNSTGGNSRIIISWDGVPWDEGEIDCIFDLPWGMRCVVLLRAMTGQRAIARANLDAAIAENNADATATANLSAGISR